MYGRQHRAVAKTGKPGALSFGRPSAMLLHGLGKVFETRKGTSWYGSVTHYRVLCRLHQNTSRSGAMTSSQSK